MPSEILEIQMDDLDKKINEFFDGKVVRKDLLHRIKKGTNIPTFVLEFLLARYCASNDPTEIEAGMEAVLATLNENYVRPNEANAAQSQVAQKGSHKFIDKVHVKYVEKERRHWASLENFASQRIAIGEKFYRDNERLLEGGIWAEVGIAYNDIEEDNYAFYIEDLQPIQMSRFDFDKYAEARSHLTRDEWLDTLLRSMGLEPAKLDLRKKMHFIARLAPLVEANYNFIELGPRGTGKSYYYSEFSPYSTLVSGGQATKSVLFYNNARRKIGLVGFWDTVAFDEIGGIKIKDPDTIQIMKDYLANGRFSRGAEIIANASMVFVGNIDQSIQQIVNSTEYDLFAPLPPHFDLAIMDRLAFYLPGWEMPKNSSDYLTDHFGLITDYLAEAFHYQLNHNNRYEEVSRRVKLGKSIEGRDEKGIKKTLCAFLKILHPIEPPTNEEFEEYVVYAIEGRRRVKEQMNKRKPDDEFANINLSYFNYADKEVEVHCHESKDAEATLHPTRIELDEKKEHGNIELVSAPPENENPSLVTKDDPVSEPEEELLEKHYKINYNDKGFSYESIISPYLKGAKSISVEDPYIRVQHQITNFVRFCETVIKHPGIKTIKLITNFDESTDILMLNDKIEELKQSLLEIDIVLKVEINENLHDREIRIDNGWAIKIGRGLDFFQKPDGWFTIGSNDLSLRPCLETNVDIYQSK